MPVVYCRILLNSVGRGSKNCNTRLNSSWRRTFCTNVGYKHYFGKEPLLALTIGQLFEKSVDKFYNKEAIISCHENSRMTFSELKQKVDTFAAGLLATGLTKGDRLGIWASNQIHWYITFLAAAKLGLVLVTLNPVYQAPEIEYCLKKVGVKALIADHKIRDENLYNTLTEIMPELPNSKAGFLDDPRFPDLKTIVFLSDEKLQGAFNVREINSFSSIETKNKLKELENEVNIDDPFNIQYTSGTTGQPKAAVLSHHSVVNNGYFIGKRLGFDPQLHDKLCIQVPLFHAFGNVASILSALPFGTTLVLASPMYSPTKTLEALKNEKCSFIFGTPTMFTDLIHLQKEKEYDLALDTILTGAAPCSPKLIDDLKNILKARKVKAIYGLTEVSAGAFLSMEEENEDAVSTTVGHVMDHLEVKIIDKEGQTLPFGSAGELCIRAYSVMKGYWQDEEKTREVLGNDKWFKTGDQFILYENGYAQIVGRFKEMIIRGGENIFPKEIEDLLNTHPNITESQVIGVYDERLGEEICACIRLKKGTSLNLEELQQFCKHKLAYFKIPKHLKIFDVFPKTGSGKIQKFRLQEIVQQK